MGVSAPGLHHTGTRPGNREVEMSDEQILEQILAHSIQSTKALARMLEMLDEIMAQNAHAAASTLPDGAMAKLSKLYTGDHAE